MSRKLPPYVSAERTRHGKMVFYFRRGKGKRTRLPPPTDEKFCKAYDACLLGSQKPKSAPAGTNSLSWLIRQHRQSSWYMGYSAATRKQRDNIFKHVEENAGKYSFKSITRSHITAGREDRKDTPFQAKNFLDAMRGLFRWAQESELVDTDPTAGVSNPKLPKGPGFEIWTDDEINKYRGKWPLGTHERVWFEVLIGTGARRGDAVTVGKQNIKGECLAIRTMKEDVWAYPPLLPELKEAIEYGPTGDLLFVVGKTGKKLTKESFGNMFRAAANAAGVKGKSAHGLRKYSATRFAEFGLSETEMETIFGWVRGSSMAAHYSKEVQRRRIAENAAGKIGNIHAPHPFTTSPHPKKDTI